MTEQLLLAEAGQDSLLRMSVVVPAYGARATLSRVLAALAPQVAGRSDREVIVVESSGDGTAEEVAERWPWVQVLTRTRRTSYGSAVNFGIRHARGELIAILDSDAIAEGGWLDALEAAAARPGVEAVAGCVVNGEPRSPIAAAGHLLEFADWSPRRRPPVLHAAGCNVLVRRAVWEREGGFPEDLWTGSDTVFSYRIGRRGALAFAPDARVAHLNRTRLRAFLWDQHKHGVGAAEIARRVDFPHRGFFTPAAAPAAAAVKLLGMVRRLRGWKETGSALLLSPFIACGLAAWTLGLVRSRDRRYPVLPLPDATLRARRS